MLSEWSPEFSIVDLVKNIERMLWTPFLGSPANRKAIPYYEENPFDAPTRPWDEPTRKPPKVTRKLPTVRRLPTVLRK